MSLALGTCTLVSSAILGAEPSTVRHDVDDAAWLRPANDYASTRYSRLSDISTTNVKSLKVAWSFATGVARGQEAAPLVVGDTMYVVTAYPNILYALDLSHAGAVRWKYEPNPAPASQGVACCDVVNRGAAYADGLVVLNTLDANTVAVDARSGRLRWRTKLGEIARGESMTMAPLIVKDKVLVGNSGGVFGARGWLAALDLHSGHIAWRAFSTGPDRDVLIGPGFKAFYPKDQGHDLGIETWPSEAWRMGGGTVWGWISYDRELDRIYYGTGSPAPWNGEQRPGDNKWASTIFARRPDTGEAVWAYQLASHDVHQSAAVSEPILLELVIEGRARKVITSAEANGYVYVLDRETGEVLSAAPYAHITTSTGVDLSSGRLRLNPPMTPRIGKVVRGMCPAFAGAKSWQPSAWSPRTGLLYIPHQNLCMDAEAVEASYIAGTPFVGMNTRMYAGPGGHRGQLAAWDPVARRMAWTIEEPFPVWSGALATAGDLVFYGTMDRRFNAVAAKTGERLWSFQTSSGVVGQPITYRGPDGKQYVAVLDGVGGWAGLVASANVDPRDASAAFGFANAMRDLPAYTGKGGTLWVFALP